MIINPEETCNDDQDATELEGAQKEAAEEREEEGGYRKGGPRVNRYGRRVPAARSLKLTARVHAARRRTNHRLAVRRHDGSLPVSRRDGP